MEVVGWFFVIAWFIFTAGAAAVFADSGDLPGAIFAGSLAASVPFGIYVS